MSNINSEQELLNDFNNLLLKIKLGSDEEWVLNFDNNSAPNSIALSFFVFFINIILILYKVLEE